MSNYNSENTHVLATREQAGGNTRMLLLHVCESGRHEYVVGSYFEQKPRGDGWDYEWYWGHYFGSFDQAAMYWLQEVGDMRIEEKAL